MIKTIAFPEGDKPCQFNTLLAYIWHKYILQSKSISLMIFNSVSIYFYFKILVQLSPCFSPLLTYKIDILR